MMFADSAYQGPVFHRALAGILPDLETGDRQAIPIA